MKVLLDTHVWLWMTTAPERIAPAVRAILADGSNVVHLSSASSWEIAIKYARGRLALPEPPATYVPSRMSLTGVTGLAIEHEHAVHVAALEPHHRDPFDRILIAQATIEGIPIVTADPAFDPYGVEVVRAAS